ncbi:hypothetical protein VPHD479_0386 [Vibrio phage D479]
MYRRGGSELENAPEDLYILFILTAKLSHLAAGPIEP